MPESTPPSSLHFGHKILGLVAVGVLCACGGVSVWQSQQKTAVVDSDIQQMTQQQPRYKSMTGSYLAGRFAAMQGDVDTALEHVSDAIAYQAGNDEIVSKAYRLSLISGDLEKALHYAKKLSPDYEDSLLTPGMLQAVMAIKRNDLAQAEKILTESEAGGINSLFVPLIQGWVEFGQGKTRNLEALVKVAAHSGEFQSLLQYQLALLFDASGKLEQAATFYDAVAETDNLSHRIMKAVANFYQRQGDQEKLAKIQQMHLQQYDLPLGDLPQERLVAKPVEGVAEIFYGIGSILYALNAHAEAEVPLQLALALRPDFASVKLLLANLREKAEKYEEALEGYRKVEDHPVFGLQARLRMALIYDELGDTDTALNLLDGLYDRYPQRNDSLLTKGDILRSREDYEGAILAYTTVLDGTETIDAKFWPVYYARGICYERAGQWQKAEADFLEAMRLEPDQPDVLNYLGYSWLTQNKHITQAKEMIEKAMAARPYDAHIIDSMGWALYHLGKYDEALKYLEQAIDLAPRDPTVNEHLGDVYWQLGYELQARYQWERALYFDPQETGQKEGIERKIASGLPAAEVPKLQVVSSDAIVEEKTSGHKEAHAVSPQSSQ